MLSVFSSAFSKRFHNKQALRLVTSSSAAMPLPFSLNRNLIDAPPVRRKMCVNKNLHNLLNYANDLTAPPIPVAMKLGEHLLLYKDSKWLLSGENKSEKNYQQDLNHITDSQLQNEIAILKFKEELLTDMLAQLTGECQLQKEEIKQLNKAIVSRHRK